MEILSEISRRLKALVRDLPISLKLIIAYSSVFVVTMVISGVAGYSFLYDAIEANIANELNNVTATMLNMVRTAANTSIKNYLRAAAEQNLEIIKHLYQKQQDGLLTEAEAKSLAREILFSQVIGKTGYIYCVDSQGNAVVHPKPKMEGRNFLDQSFIRDQIELKDGYTEYEWGNPGENRARPKAAYTVYFKPWDWYINVSSYREEFAELVKVSDFRESILAPRFGKTGYSYVFNSKGDVVVHPLLKGNYFNATDGQGKYFVREICEKKKGKLVYSWKNPGESVFRDKLVIFNYIPEYDWIVVSSCYLEEFYDPLFKLRNTVLTSVLGTLVVMLPLTLLISGSILKPLKSLMSRFADGKSGDLSVRMEVASRDEVGQLARYFNNFMERLETYRDKMLEEIRERKQTEEALRESESKYRGILENMQEGYYELDLDGNFTFFNDSLSAILGYSASELAGMNIRNITDQTVAEGIFQTFDLIKKSGTPTQESRCEMIKKDGSECSVEVSISQIVDKDGTAVGFRGVLRDITSRKRSEEALQRSEEMFSKAFQCSPSGMLIATLNEGRLVKVNDSFLRCTGYALSDLKGKSLLDREFVLDEAFARDLVESVGRQGRLAAQEIRFFSAERESRSGIVSAELVELWGETCILAALEDVTDSKRLEQEILEVSEREHRKIGRDLHDDLCPHLIGIEVLSKVLQRKLDNISLAEADDAAKIQRLIQDSIKKLRRLSKGLCPIDLQDEGFESSIASLGLYVEDIFRVTYHFECGAPVNLVDETVATHIYYIVHEAVYNAAKHAEARNIFVKFASDNGMMEISIRDDGRGIPRQYTAKGMGLRIMNYRARIIGAAIEIGRDRGRGTVVTLRLRNP